MTDSRCHYAHCSGLHSHHESATSKLRLPEGACDTPDSRARLRIAVVGGLVSRLLAGNNFEGTHGIGREVFDDFQEGHLRDSLRTAEKQRNRAGGLVLVVV